MDRIRRLLDAWNPFNANVPEALRITTLPNTTERYMKEERGQSMSHIRRMQERKSTRKVPTSDFNKQYRREVVDKYCNFCGAFGHITTNHEFMAKLLIANESLSKVDSKVKKELQEMFHGKQQKQQEKCLKTKANVIRKLLDSGASREDIKVVLDTLPDSIDDDHDDIQDAQHGTADTEKVSTTSNLE